MAGYIVTSGSNFRPFTYDELIKPVMQMTEWHNAAADEYDKLAMDTQALQNYIDSTKDKQASELYQAYQQKLLALQNNLLEKGFNTGTRRDLATARAGYASDITRLSKAIESRQNRSKEYWDMRHKNPDLIMGNDPGVASLDEYLADDNYGQNWYSYSGNTFSDEVAQEIDARANELLRDPEVSRIPGLAGYLDLKRRQGFTNYEINTAGNASWAYLNGDPTLYENLNPVQRIAADVLINRMDSTGASFGENGNVSEDEFRRLFQYGLRGAARGIKAPDVRTVEDKNWDFQKQIALMNLKSAADAAAQNASGGTGYVLDAAIPTTYAEGADKQSTTLSRMLGTDAFKNGPVMVNMPDGSSVPVSSAAEMTSLMYDTPERRMIQERFGIDIALPEQNWLGTSGSRQTFTVERGGKTATFSTGKLSNKEAKRLGLDPKNSFAIRQNINGRQVLNDSYTKAFNDALAAHNRHVETMQKMNRNQFKRDKYSVSPKEEQRLKTDYQLDSRLNVSDIPVVMAAKNFINSSTPAILVDNSEPMSSVRQDYQNMIISSVRQGLQNLGQSPHKNRQTEFAFYPAIKGSTEFEKKGTTDISEVFATNKSTGYPVNGSLKSITATPEDLAKGMVRIETEKGIFGINANMLGSLTGGIIGSDRFKSNLNSLLLPFTSADKMLLDHGNETVDISYRGTPLRVTYNDIIRNPSVQSAYYDSVLGAINQALAGPREMKGQQHFQSIGNTSTKPANYNALGR